jgi:hypothetical protein
MPKIWTKSDGPAKEGKFLVVRRDGSVPHWPHFVLGARDPQAAYALRLYAVAVIESGGDRAYARSIQDLADDFDAYRHSEGDGDPPAGPHRKDDPQVIRAMCGLSSTINVSIDESNVRKDTAHV